MTGTHEKLPKPCRVLRALGKCTNTDGLCEYPLGRRTKCFAAYEKDDRSVAHLLDMTLELRDEISDDGKVKVPVFSQRSW